MNVSKATRSQLPPPLKKAVLRAVKNACEFSSEPYSASNGVSIAEATVIAGEIAESIGVNIENTLDALHKKTAQAITRRPTKAAIVELRRYMPNWQPNATSKSDTTTRYPIAAFEQMVLDVLCSRESESAMRAARLRKYRVAEFIANWPWSEQEWWEKINKSLGSDRSRLFLTGLLSTF